MCGALGEGVFDRGVGLGVRSEEGRCGGGRCVRFAVRSSDALCLAFLILFDLFGSFFARSEGFEGLRYIL